MCIRDRLTTAGWFDGDVVPNNTLQPVRTKAVMTVAILIFIVCCLYFMMLPLLSFNSFFSSLSVVAICTMEGVFCPQDQEGSFKLFFNLSAFNFGDNGDSMILLKLFLCRSHGIKK